MKVFNSIYEHCEFRFITLLSENENIYMHACGPMIRNNLDSIQSAVDVRGVFNHVSWLCRILAHDVCDIGDALTEKDIGMASANGQASHETQWWD